MPELELRVTRLGRGSAAIPGWVDGRTLAVITHRGLDGPEDKRGPYTREYSSMVEAMQAMGSIEMYVNLALVSARMIVTEPDTGPGRLRELLVTARGRAEELLPKGCKDYADMRLGMAVLICSAAGLNSYYRSEDVELILHAIEGGRLIEDAIARLQRAGRASS
jgi:hypothetical protein